MMVTVARPVKPQRRYFLSPIRPDSTTERTVTGESVDAADDSEAGQESFHGLTG